MLEKKSEKKYTIERERKKYEQLIELLISVTILTQKITL